MLKLRRSEQRGLSEHSWLKSYHSFSFADYYDPEYLDWGNLRVINDDYIKPGTGFGKHSHKNMEIITYVMSGELAHQDSMGNIKTIQAGEVQAMSAGKGVIHSEFNNSKSSTTHLLQIWIKPQLHNIEPSYQQKKFSNEEKNNQLRLIASKNCENGSMIINADAKIYSGIFNQYSKNTFKIDHQRKFYVHLIQGQVMINNETLGGGDAVMIENEDSLSIENGSAAELLLFDLKI